MSKMNENRNTSGEQGDAGRRRVVRGAVALAPLVLTLRSGALAAASCTGVKIASVKVNDNGKIKNASSLALQSTDRCVQPGVLQACGDPGSNKVLTSSPITESNSVQVRYNDENDVWTCGNRQFRGQNVAILSSQSVASMGVTRG